MSNLASALLVEQSTMLSTMRQKISKEISSSSVGATGPDVIANEKEASNLAGPSSIHTNQAQTIVSFVPPAKVYVPGGTASATSSLASLEYHAFASLSRNSDDETFDGSPPLSSHTSNVGESNESRDRAERIFVVPCDTQIYNSEPPTGSSRKRSVTITTVSDYQDSAASLPSSSKKPRLPHDNNTVSVIGHPLQPIAPNPVSNHLLARSMDEQVLNPLHCFVRLQIEVFTATQAEMAQPAPGRKNPIQVHQVGLRCIHCRDLSPKDRVKRAVCYPSSVGRVYHSVSDMKFDHFGSCKGIPKETRETLMELKEASKKKRARKASPKNMSCSSSTAQYYHDSACQMGMLDSHAGVFLNVSPLDKRHVIPSKSVASSLADQMSVAVHLVKVARTSHSSHGFGYNHSSGSLNGTSPTAPQTSQDLLQSSMPSQSFTPLLFSRLPNGANNDSHAVPVGSSRVIPHEGAVILAASSDAKHLNPLHCFVRRHIEVFAADKEDMSAPSPGRKTRVVLGQVGIRCVHCANLPLKNKVKRAVCYPPSVNGIYHSVSNMKFDHFGICRGLSPKDRAEFTTLRTCSGRRGVPKGATKDSANSTAQYYQDSAALLGLVDTEEGIRFKDATVAGSSLPSLTAISASSSSLSFTGTETPKTVPDGISALMIAATDPKVQAAYRMRHQHV